MRELTVRIRFTTHSLGAVRSRDGSDRFLLQRSPTSGAVTFLASWHHNNMRRAAQILCKHQDEVGKILWSIEVDGVRLKRGWHRRYYRIGRNGKKHYIIHEAFLPGQVIGLNCVVPSTISHDDFWRLMQLAGQYCGLSPFGLGEYGRYEVETIQLRRPQLNNDDSPKEVGEKEKDVRATTSDVPHAR